MQKKIFIISFLSSSSMGLYTEPRIFKLSYCMSVCLVHRLVTLMYSFMVPQAVALRKCLVAVKTLVRLFTSVHSFVGLHTRFLMEGLFTILTAKWLLSCVCSLMAKLAAFRLEALFTMLTGIPNV